MTNFSTLSLPPINAFSNAVLLLASVLIVKFVISYFIAHDPLKYFRFYCDKLSEKVNRKTNSTRQKSIAGLVAIVVTLAPLVIILWLFEAFIEVQWLWQALLLFLALGPFGIEKVSKGIAQDLVANKNYLAKQNLNNWVLRETTQLSTMGLSKACIEMQLLRALQQNITIACYFLIAGPLAALTVRLLLEMHYSWNIKRDKFKAFGSQVNHIVNLLQWLPTRLFTLVLLLSLLGKNIVLFWRLLNGKFFQLNNGIALHCLALALEVKLGGVAIYDGLKVRKASFNEHARQPEPTDIIHASKTINKVLFISLFCLVCIAFLIIFIQAEAN